MPSWTRTLLFCRCTSAKTRALQIRRPDSSVVGHRSEHGRRGGPMDPMKSVEVTAQEQTAQAERETKHLQKTLGRLDIIFLIVAAVVSIEVLAQVSGFGGQTFTWALVLAVLFLVPYGLIFAEIGSTFTGEGGVYVWVRQAFGRPA